MSATMEVAGLNAPALPLLMGVDMPVSFWFGRVRLTLQELAALHAGSMVELNRSTADPVTILVNDCEVARGELVVVDGNYGVRILEISPAPAALKRSKEGVAA